MATKKRIILHDTLYHITTRLVNKELWFNVYKVAKRKGKKKGIRMNNIHPMSLNRLRKVPRREIVILIEKVMKHLNKKYGFKIYHFLIMDDHYHMIAKTTNPKYKLDSCMRVFNMMIAKGINRLTKRTGHVFGSRYKSNAILDEDYAKIVLGYIYANPVKAKMVKKPEHHDYTSYKNYVLKKYDHLPIETDCPILEGESKDKERYGEILKELVEGYIYERVGIRHETFVSKLKCQVLVKKESFERLNEDLKTLILKVEKNFCEG